MSERKRMAIMRSHLRNYTFLPWTAPGDSRRRSRRPTTSASRQRRRRARVRSIGQLQRSTAEPISKEVQLLGPGDVIGINPRAIVKTEPRNWVTDFESNYLPYIEFYEEDFPVALHAGDAPVDALAQSRLRPWIFLVVLDGRRVRRAQARRTAAGVRADQRGSRSGIVLPAAGSELGVGARPRQPEHHRQHAADRDRAEAQRRRAERWSRRLRANADRRVVAAAVRAQARRTTRRITRSWSRRSRPDGWRASARHSAGQRAAAGAVVGRRSARRIRSITAGSSAPATKGDFEFLVDLLEPRPVDKRVGVRAMDMQDPGYEVERHDRPARGDGTRRRAEEPGDRSRRPGSGRPPERTSTIRPPDPPAVS